MTTTLKVGDWATFPGEGQAVFQISLVDGEGMIYRRSGNSAHVPVYGAVLHQTPKPTLDAIPNPVFDKMVQHVRSAMRSAVDGDGDPETVAENCVAWVFRELDKVLIETDINNLLNDYRQAIVTSHHQRTYGERGEAAVQEHEARFRLMAALKATQS